MSVNQIISYHNFMFPFDFAYGKDNGKINLYQIIRKIENNNWDFIKEFKVNDTPDDIPNYNEYNYFNEQARHILYVRECIKRNRSNCENTECTNENENYCFKKSESFYFTKKEAKTYKYTINIEDYVPSKYTLDVSDISLRIFRHGIGILCFHLENYQYKKIDDILKINQFGRRIYPPFLTYNKRNNKTSSKTSELAISITIENSSPLIKTDFENKKSKLEFIIKNLCDCFVETPSIDENKIQINPLLDDRMFVLCWYGNDNFSSDLATESYPNLSFHSSDKWYEFLFIDNPGKASCQNSKMKKNLIEKSTYQRWSNYGTLYGITRYSFVCSTSSYESLKNNDALFLIDHMRTMYYQMLVLTFVQRISILRFKKRIKNALENNDTDKFEKIHNQYLSFINRICLSEVTHQEQGIEMYNMMRDIMGINESSKELKEEIQELFNLAQYKKSEEANKKNDETNEKLNLITVVGGIIGVSSLLVSLMDLKKDSALSIFLIILFTGLTIGASIRTWKFFEKNFKILEKIKNLEKKGKHDLSIITALLLLLIIISILFSSKIIDTSSQNITDTTQGINTPLKE